MVFNDPAFNGRSVVELAEGHLVALLGDCTKRICRPTKVHGKNEPWPIRNPREKLGIIGWATSDARLQSGSRLGMEVWFYDNRPVAQEVGEEMGWAYCDDLGKLFAGSDIVTVHISAKDAHGNDNVNLLDTHLGALGSDRPSTSPRLFLNLARGNLHTPEALLDAVASGAIRRAAVDVYPEEPGPGQKSWDNPYANEPRVICTPHIGAATQEAQPALPVVLHPQWKHSIVLHNERLCLRARTKCRA